MSRVSQNIIRCSDDAKRPSYPLKSNLSICIGDGSKISFWNDKWSPLGNLKEKFGRLFQASVAQDVSLASAVILAPLSLNFEAWRRHLYDWEINQCKLFDVELSKVSFNRHAEDRWKWDNKKGEFSVKDGKDFITKSSLPRATIPNLWTILGPPKVQCFLWQLINEGTAVKVNLVRRGILPPDQRPSFKDKLLQWRSGVTPHVVMDEFKVEPTDITVERKAQGPSIRLSDRKREHIRKPWANSVYVRLLGASIAYRTLCSQIAKMWKLAGGFRVMDLDNGYFLVSFNRGRISTG
ncbi:hypothetical protein Tsubulata_021588 [Turnera subulata]|uniref:Reverse transcriptase zinc-binding domain-containing protein n=1 Tax=Turnera subulata TaxID=218843 RepID=A0A9Q0JQ85_9ROSI|nr:hypothetical protein Tsubulata_021588 [Turnera subulata]